MTTNTSYLSLPESIVDGDAEVPISKFVSLDANLFPKMPGCINESAFETWFFDGVSYNGQSGLAVGFFRGGGVRKNPFRIQVDALGPDGAKWSTQVHFLETIVTENNGRVIGTWQTQSPDGISKATFDIAPDLSTAHVTFNGIATVSGSATWTAKDPKPTMLPVGEEEAKLGPHIYYIRPLSIANTLVVAHLIFPEVAEKGQYTDARELRLTPEQNAAGGMDRVWSSFSWQQLMTENYHLRATVGPYRLHVMSIVSTVAEGRVPYASARLFKDQEVLCAAQDAVSDEIVKCDRDCVIVEKVYGDDVDAVRGHFRDRNIGYRIVFVQRRRKTERELWQFDVRHIHEWWNRPTSAPGPNGTGNSAFIARVTGGLVTKEHSESCEGFAGSGQVELPRVD